MSLTLSSVTSSKSRLVGASTVQCAIPPVLPVGPAPTPNDISHHPEVKTYLVHAERAHQACRVTLARPAGTARAAHQACHVTLSPPGPAGGPADTMWMPRSCSQVCMV